jgi:ABC-type nitrate/sulfonate/bicarbonate transport system substrate-binding protein
LYTLIYAPDPGGMRQVRLGLSGVPTLIAVVWLGASGCSVEPPTPGKGRDREDRVSLKLDGRHGTRFLGFYVAGGRGFYADEGIEVRVEEISSADEGDTVPIRTAAGEFDFAIGSGVLLQGQQAGLPLVVVSNICQFGPQALLVRADSGILAPADLAGKRVVVRTSSWREWIERLLAHEGLTLGEIEAVSGGADMTPFFDGEVDAWAGSLVSEAAAARSEGIDVVTFPLHEYGISTIGDSLYTRREYLETKRDLVERFVRASLRGWLWAVENPEEAVDEMLSSDALIPLVRPPGAAVGRPDCEVWAGRLLPEASSGTEGFCDSGIFERAMEKERE